MTYGHKLTLLRPYSSNKQTIGGNPNSKLAVYIDTRTVFLSNLQVGLHVGLQDIIHTYIYVASDPYLPSTTSTKHHFSGPVHSGPVTNIPHGWMNFNLN